jgi:hypothetical protein
MLCYNITSLFTDSFACLLLYILSCRPVLPPQTTSFEVKVVVFKFQFELAAIVVRVDQDCPVVRVLRTASKFFRQRGQSWDRTAAMTIDAENRFGNPRWGSKLVCWKLSGRNLRLTTDTAFDDEVRNSFARRKPWLAVLPMDLHGHHWRYYADIAADFLRSWEPTDSQYCGNVLEE